MAQNVLQQRWYVSEPLVARRGSVEKPLGLPCGAFETTGSYRVGGAKKKIPGLKGPSGYATKGVFPVLSRRYTEEKLFGFQKGILTIVFIQWSVYTVYILFCVRQLRAYRSRLQQHNRSKQIKSKRQ